jgi:hypothetical protein
MPALTWLSHHRFWILGLGITTLVAVIAAGVWFFLVRSPGTQIDLRQALRLYREGQPVKGADLNKRLPPSGVYRYKTSGGERLSIGGISRSFPTTTEMVVTDTGCATITWYPLEQHTEGVVVCSVGRGGLLMTSAVSDEQIAGVHANETFHCPADAYFVPPHPRAGEQWHSTCHGMGERVALSGRVVATSDMTVGGRAVPALHTRLTLSFAGSEAGTNPTDYWVSTQNGLILAERETVEMQQGSGPLGSVHYDEQMDLSLDRTAPVR